MRLKSLQGMASLSNSVLDVNESMNGAVCLCWRLKSGTLNQLIHTHLDPAKDVVPTITPRETEHLDPDVFEKSSRGARSFFWLRTA
jgi:hypothetical protein